MDQGTQEASIAPTSELVKQRYQKLRDAFLHDETLINELLFQLESQGKKGERVLAPSIPVLHLMEIDQRRTRMLLEWVKTAFDVEENQLESTFKRINDFVKEYTPMLEEIRKERERFKGSVRTIGP